MEALFGDLHRGARREEFSPGTSTLAQQRTAAADTFSPAFSPNGKMLTFVRVNYQKENDRLAVFVQPIGSPEDAQRITPWKLNCQDLPEFSPTASWVFFRCQPKGEEGPSNLYWVHPDGTGLHQITHAPADKQYLTSFPSFSEGEG